MISDYPRQDRGGDTNLILACKGGHKAIVEALLKRYADVDTRVSAELSRDQRNVANTI